MLPKTVFHYYILCLRNYKCIFIHLCIFLFCFVFWMLESRLYLMDYFTTKHRTQRVSCEEDGRWERVEALHLQNCKTENKNKKRKKSFTRVGTCSSDSEVIWDAHASYQSPWVCMDPNFPSFFLFHFWFRFLLMYSMGGSRRRPKGLASYHSRCKLRMSSRLLDLAYSSPGHCALSASGEWVSESKKSGCVSIFQNKFFFSN